MWWNNKLYLKKISSKKDDNSFSLPSEKTLINKFSVSRTTIRYCLQKLCNKGITYAKKGSGYYVNAHYFYTKIGVENVKNLRLKYKVIEKNLSKDILLDVLNTLNLDPEDINFNDYLGYLKICYNRQNKALGYYKSFCFLPAFGTLDWKQIELSWPNYIKKNNIILRNSINTIIIENSDELDKKYLSNKVNQVCVIYSAKFDNKNHIIKIVEKRILMDYFLVNYIKMY
ncbi:GntR family transcriptional regulator [Spiroplasma endosymbiont of Stenodema calcarata]|uniref:GntR family transcriptional regulator n=1 Tax=Spiroplasma endosymbiont of Stenodema calcarata TaxID=3139328 RepID=UPI003CCAEBD6